MSVSVRSASQMLFLEEYIRESIALALQAEDLTAPETHCNDETRPEDIDPK